MWNVSTEKYIILTIRQAAQMSFDPVYGWGHTGPLYYKGKLVIIQDALEAPESIGLLPHTPDTDY